MHRQNDRETDNAIEWQMTLRVRCDVFVYAVKIPQHHAYAKSIQKHVTEPILPEKDGRTDGRMDTQINTCGSNSSKETDTQTEMYKQSDREPHKNNVTEPILPEKKQRTDRRKEKHTN